MGNAGTSALPKVRAWRATPQNLLDFAFTRDKINTKQKDFHYPVEERQVCAARTAHSYGVEKHFVQAKSGYAPWLHTPKLRRKVDLQIMRKWILASLRRASERYAILSYSYVTVAQAERGPFPGRKKKNVFQQNLWAMRASVLYQGLGRVGRHRKIFWILLSSIKGKTKQKDFANFRARVQVPATPHCT